MDAGARDGVSCCIGFDVRKDAVVLLAIEWMSVAPMNSALKVLRVFDGYGAKGRRGTHFVSIEL